MTGIIIISAIAIGALLYAASRKLPNGLEGLHEPPISAANIRRGVSNGWYSCILTIVNDIPAAYLYGKTKDGKNYADVYRISQADYDALKNEGYEEDMTIWQTLAS